MDDTRTEQGRVRDLYRRIRSTIGCRRLYPGGMTSAGSIFPRRRPVSATHSIPAKLDEDIRFLISYTALSLSYLSPVTTLASNASSFALPPVSSRFSTMVKPKQDSIEEEVDVKGHRIRGIQDHALIGNLRTAAVISLDASIQSMCIPYFDSPSVFARIVDADKGGHFSLNPTWAYKPKQAYAPNSNILVTKFLSEDGIAMVTDLLVPKGANKLGSQNRGPLPWLIRKVESISGKVPFRMECAPAFNYCRDKHTTEVSLSSGRSSQSMVLTVDCGRRLRADWLWAQPKGPVQLGKPFPRSAIHYLVERRWGRTQYRYQGGRPVRTWPARPGVYG